MIKDELKQLFTKDENLFQEGFRLNKSTPFKVVPTNGGVIDLPEYQNSLIELIQGFSLYTNKTVEKDKNYNGWVTDKPDPIYDGLEILKMFMLDSSQMYELHSSRTLTIKKAEKKRKKLLKKKLKEQGLTIKNLKKESKKNITQIDEYFELLEKSISKDKLAKIKKEVLEVTK